MRNVTSLDAAIAQAAHDTLVVLFPSQSAAFDELLVKDLGQIRVRNKRTKVNGIKLGQQAAARILALRAQTARSMPNRASTSITSRAMRRENGART